MTEKYIPALRFPFLTRYYDILVAWTTSESKFRSLMLDHLALQDGETFLDIACGTLASHSNTRNIKMIGLDGDLTVLEIAKRKNAKLYQTGKIKFIHAFADETGIESNSVDVASTSLFFHHLSDKAKVDVLKEIKRVLKNDGRLIFCDWDAPKSIVEKVGFYIVRLLDGLEVTQSSFSGEIDRVLKREFSSVKKVESISVPLGRISIWVLEK